MPSVELLTTGFRINTSQGRLGFCTVTLIRGQQNYLVDVASYGRRVLLADALGAVGLTPEDIGGVILTHSHWDHVQNIDMFPRSRVYVHPVEVEYSRNPTAQDWATPRYFERTLEGMDVREVKEGTEIEPGITIVDTPGHSKGSMSILVETGEGLVAVTGDAVTSAGAALRGTPELIFWDEEEARHSVSKVLGLTRTIYGGHDRPFRIDAHQQVEYLGGADSIRVFGTLDHTSQAISLHICLEPRPSVAGPAVEPGPPAKS